MQNINKNNEFEVCRKTKINAKKRDNFKNELKFINTRVVILKTNLYY